MNRSLLSDKNAPKPLRKLSIILYEHVTYLTLYRTTDEDNVEEETPRKKQRKLVENADARNLREQDRQRLAEQEERRTRLQMTLALHDQGGDINNSKVIVNDAKADDQGYVYVHPHISNKIKKHQIDGIRFMWYQIVGDKNAMQGCLLAHTMGLGKTMQV